MGISLALGGGGARGMAHVGILKVLHREAIPVTAIAGTSMGAIIGSAYAAGVPIDQIETFALRVRSRREQIRLVDLKLSISSSGLLRGTRVYRMLAEMLGEERTFEEMEIPFAVVATDMRTGREVILQDGKIVDAIRATMSVPGVFEPVKRGDMLLADGGILNNVPVDVARRIGKSPVVAVDVLPAFTQNQVGMPPVVPPLQAALIPGSVQDLLHAYLIMIAQLTEYRLRACPAEVVIRPTLPIEVGLLNGFERASELIAAGEAAAEAALPAIYEAMQRSNIDPLQ
jgi:NTE family protein